MKNPVLYRVYTEGKPSLSGIVQATLPAATILYGDGLYAGAYEYAAVVEYLAPDTRESDEAISTLASEIARVNEQVSVLVAKLPVLSVTEFQGKGEANMRDNFGAPSNSEQSKPPMPPIPDHDYVRVSPGQFVIRPFTPKDARE